MKLVSMSSIVEFGRKLEAFDRAVAEELARLARKERRRIIVRRLLSCLFLALFALAGAWLAMECMT